MSTKDEALARMRNNPRDWKIEDLEAIAGKLGMSIRRPGGSHVIFSLPGQAGELSVPAHRPIKPIYIKKFVALAEALAKED